MRRLSAIPFLILAALALLPGPSAAQSADLAAEEQQIGALNEGWLAAIAAKDVAAVAELYAEDGAILPPGSPIAEGRDAVAETWKGLFALPGFGLVFSPTRLEVASSGDMAYEIGNYELDFETDQGPLQDHGKYVVVWRKVDGAWKVAADIFNSNEAGQ